MLQNLRSSFFDRRLFSDRRFAASIADRKKRRLFSLRVSINRERERKKRKPRKSSFKVPTFRGSLFTHFGPSSPLVSCNFFFSCVFEIKRLRRRFMQQATTGRKSSSDIIYIYFFRACLLTLIVQQQRQQQQQLPRHGQGTATTTEATTPTTTIS